MSDFPTENRRRALVLLYGLSRVGKKVLEIRYCRYVSDAKESLVIRGTNYTMFVPDLNAEVNLAVSAGRVGWYKKKSKEINYTGVVQCANRDGKH